MWWGWWSGTEERSELEPSPGFLTCESAPGSSGNGGQETGRGADGGPTGRCGPHLAAAARRECSVRLQAPRAEGMRRPRLRPSRQPDMNGQPGAQTVESGKWGPLLTLHRRVALDKHFSRLIFPWLIGKISFTLEGC